MFTRPPPHYVRMTPSRYSQVMSNVRSNASSFCCDKNNPAPLRGPTWCFLSKYVVLWFIIVCFARHLATSSTPQRVIGKLSLWHHKPPNNHRILWIHKIFTKSQKSATCTFHFLSFRIPRSGWVSPCCRSCRAFFKYGPQLRRHRVARGGSFTGL